MFCLYNFSTHNLNFHRRWRWWDKIQAIFSNLFYFKIDKTKTPLLIQIFFSWYLKLRFVTNTFRPKILKNSHCDTPLHYNTAAPWRKLGFLPLKPPSIFLQCRPITLPIILYFPLPTTIQFCVCVNYQSAGNSSVNSDKKSLHQILQQLIQCKNQFLSYKSILTFWLLLHICNSKRTDK